MNNKEKLNNMNVFPIPDGDTGINMEKTMLGAINAMKSIGRDITPDDMDFLYDNMLMSAQGNSGVILSQWFKGFFNTLKNAEEIDAPTLNEAFMNASEASYHAVTKPVEGTFLTVARESYETAEETLCEEPSVSEYLESVLEGAEESLKNTPELLPVLKEAGVVDSGGMGYVCIVSGMLNAINGCEEVSFDDFDSAINVSTAKNNEDFGYCTELILHVNKSGFDPDEMKNHLESIGESLILINDDRRVKIHVHTLKPEEVLAYCHQFGEFLTLKIENMSVQNQQMNAQKKCEIVAVVNGNGISDLFSSAGADRILVGDDANNVSIKALTECFSASSAQNIILLPNNKNLFLVAQQAQKQTDKNIHIVNTSSIAEGYNALSIVNPDDDIDTIINDMNNEISNTITGLIAKAVRDSNVDSQNIKKGQYIATVNEKAVSSCDDVLDTMVGMLESIKDIQDKESVLVICSTDERKLLIESQSDIIHSICPNAEVFFIVGSQKIVDYIFAIE